MTVVTCCTLSTTCKMVVLARSTMASARLHRLHRIADQGLDLARRFGRALRQRTHLARHHRKTTTLLSGARCLHGGVQCQATGVERNRINDADDIDNFLRRRLDAPHRCSALLVLRCRPGQLRRTCAASGRRPGLHGAAPYCTAAASAPAWRAPCARRRRSGVRYGAPAPHCGVATRRWVTVMASVPSRTGRRCCAW